MRGRTIRHATLVGLSLQYNGRPSVPIYRNRGSHVHPLTLAAPGGNALPVDLSRKGVISGVARLLYPSPSIPPNRTAAEVIIPTTRMQWVVETRRFNPVQPGIARLGVLLKDERMLAGVRIVTEEEFSLAARYRKA